MREKPPPGPKMHGRPRNVPRARAKDQVDRTAEATKRQVDKTADGATERVDRVRGESPTAEEPPTGV